MKKKILQLLGMVLFVGLLAGCGSNNEKTVVFSDAGWDSVKFHNAVAGLIAEKAYGLKVETMNGSTPIMEAALVRGDVDVNMELWTDNVATYQADKAAGGIVDLGINFDDNKQGLYVPRYVIEGDPQRGGGFRLVVAVFQQGLLDGRAFQLFHGAGEVAIGAWSGGRG